LSGSDDKKPDVQRLIKAEIGVIAKHGKIGRVGANRVYNINHMDRGGTNPPTSSAVSNAIDRIWHRKVIDGEKAANAAETSATAAFDGVLQTRGEKLWHGND
jgi:hypothetical protein